MSVFHLPDLGEGLPDAEIHEWLVKEGDSVEIDQPIVSMETAKAVVEVPSPFSGVIKKCHGNPGDRILTGNILVEFEGTTERQSATVAGKLEESNVILVERVIEVQQSTSSSIKAAPAIRALAKQLNVDLEKVSATGPHGTITADDVKRAKATAVNSPAEHVAAFSDGESIKGVRRAMADAMAKAYQEVAMVTVSDEADITDWVKTGDITARLIEAMSAACVAEPSLNAWFDGKNFTRKLHSSVDLGLAMDTEDGLFVPVIRNANQKSAAELRQTVDRFKEQVKNRTVPSEDLKNPTITLSNFGKFGGRVATPVVVPPQVAILAAGSVREGVAVHQGAVAVRTLMTLSLTFDHRAVTGGEATRFLNKVIAALQKVAE